ncbi:copia protein [Tanacetum coccineum]
MQVQKTVLMQGILKNKMNLLKTTLYCQYGLLILQLCTLAKASSTNLVNTVSIPVSAASPHEGLSLSDPTNPEQDDSEIPPLEDIYQNSTDALILGDPTSAVQTRSKVNKSSGAHAFVSYVQNWVGLLCKEDLLHVQVQKVWIPVDLPLGREKAIAPKQGRYQTYDEVFAPVARIEAIRIFLAFASYMGFIVYQMDVKSAFLYGKIDEEVYVSQPPGFLDPKYPQKVYKVCDEFEALMKSRFQMSSMGELTFFLGLQVKQKEDGIFIRPDIWFAVCAVLDFRFTSKSSHLRNPQQEVVNFLAEDSFLGNEKQTIMVLLLQRNHFIRDVYEKKLIQVLKSKRVEIVADSTNQGILMLAVSTDSAKLVPLGKVCTAIETLKKNTAKALISLLTTITLSTTMAVLDSCPKHNMVAYLEKSEGNAEFHEIIDFLTRSSIHHASLHITAKVAGKPVSISDGIIRILWDEKKEGPRKEEQVFLDELERLKRQEKEANEEAEALRKQYTQENKNLVIQAGAAKASSTNIFSTVSTPAKASSINLVNTVGIPVSTASPNEGLSLSDPSNPEQDDSEIPPLEDIYQNSSSQI